ncbi:uncharacterized protein LOC114352522 [Ostrinia furnacalis]|uniref:uncharacterized protein LOC114352522 n=1 Tax=Ostrinia furnacalis TaxID=93504 RepID=UPI00103ACE3F|nr:uncharacterized protein LOC114352522 [Ostrinia furnacalis]
MTDAREIFLRNILQTIAVDQKYEDADIETSIKPTTGSNFTSRLFNGTIKSKGKEPIKIFAKVAIISELFREQVKTRIFDIERTFYTKLAKSYREIEERHNVPEEYRLVIPKYYGGNDAYLKEVIVLQDLYIDGFDTYDRFRPIDWDYASKAVEELAKLHALSIAFQIEYPDDYEEYSKVLKREKMEEDSIIAVTMKQMVSKTIKMIREENREKVERFFDSFSMEETQKFYEPLKKPVIVHSDFKQNNLMHKFDEDGKLQIVIVDYQSLHPGSAANDLLYFIFTGSDGAFRAKYFDRFVDHYYEHMAAALRRLDLDPEEAFPRDIFDEELKEMLPFALMVSGMMLPMIFKDEEQFGNVDGGVLKNIDDFEGISDLMTRANQFAVQRLNEIVDDYVRWGVL